MCSFRLVTVPASEPVALDDIKAHIRVDEDTDNSLISALITAAREWSENYTGRSFITQTWRLWQDNWPQPQGNDNASYVALPRPPLVSVSSVKLYDEDDNFTVWDAGNYFVDNAREPGRLVLRSGAVWPTFERAANGIAIEYVAGYGSDVASVPETIKTAIKQLVAHWYEHRGDAALSPSTRGDTMTLQAFVNIPLVIQALLAPYRIFGVSGR